MSVNVIVLDERLFCDCSLSLYMYYLASTLLRFRSVVVVYLEYVNLFLLETLYTCKHTALKNGLIGIAV